MKSILLASGFSLLCALALEAQTPSPPELSPSSTASFSPSATVVPTLSPSPAPSASLAPALSPTPAPSASSPNAFAEKIKRNARNGHSKGFHINIDDSDGSEHASGSHHDNDGIPEAVIPIVAISVIGFFGFPVAIVAVIMFSSWAKSRSLHRTVRTLVEKGQPIPPELLASRAGTGLRPWYDLRRGIILLAVGMGVIFFFASVAGWDTGVWALGLIPAIMGAGYILAWRLANKQANGFKV